MTLAALRANFRPIKYSYSPYSPFLGSATIAAFLDPRDVVVIKDEQVDRFGSGR
jgi:hypothetical protein